MIPAPCTICRRACCGIGFVSPEVRAVFCSMKCSEIWMKARTKKEPFTPSEKGAVAAGGKVAGQWLEGIGKTDLAEMTRAEWEEFCGVLFAGVCADLQRQADEGIPF